ncbi:MAG TPA: MarR family transcriptional regulator, partial [Myxococcales bacterium]|nr:MarR family transcriptional regulator [Myxococcales bacterium]
MSDVDEIQEPEDENAPLGAVLDFMRLLWAVDHSLQSASKRMEAVYGI